MQTNGHTTISDKIEGTVMCKTPEGANVAGRILRITRHLAVFEIDDPNCVLATSEKLDDFEVRLNGQRVYKGSAVIANIIHTGVFFICEATLHENWADVPTLVNGGENQLTSRFNDFVREWQKFYKIDPQYKAIVADIQAFLSDLRLWLDHLELGIRSPGNSQALQIEQEAVRQLGESTTPLLTSLFEKFEEAAARVSDELRPAHSAFVKRQLHSLLLSSPFLLRTYKKPLGYAGDYEMVNMIVRDAREGDSIFAKVVNVWFLHQPPAEAHRNRIEYLNDRISEVTLKCISAGRKARILSLGCGPAGEVQKFIRENHYSNSAHFTLLDFSEETLANTRVVLEQLQKECGRNASLQFVKKSVAQIFKDSVGKAAALFRGQYDFVYCAGLFDYLSDAFCQRLSTILYDWVAPGGLFVSTNVDASNPRRLTMEYIMEWNLIYRNGAELAAVRPEQLTLENGQVLADVTGVNIYYEARKPAA
jgi:extracellular factor (EF) 3-hydroxypalmitic acid methyl ester biosynthesis protein